MIEQIRDDPTPNIGDHMRHRVMILALLALAFTLPVHGAMTINYTYDSLGRLIGISYSEETMSGDIAYEYDNVGNIPQLTISATSAPGDLNFDGLVNLTDAVMMLKTLAGQHTPEMSMQAKVTAGDHLGMGEVIYILRKAAE